MTVARAISGLALLLWSTALAHPDHHHPHQHAEHQRLLIKQEAGLLWGGLKLNAEGLLTLNPLLDLNRVPRTNTLEDLRDRSAELLTGQLYIEVNGQAVVPQVDAVSLILPVPPVALQQISPVWGIAVINGPPGLLIQFHCAAQPDLKQLHLSWAWPDTTLAGSLHLADSVTEFELPPHQRDFNWYAPGFTPKPKTRPVLAVSLLVLGGVFLIWLLRRRSWAVLISLLLATGCAALNLWKLG